MRKIKFDRCIYSMSYMLIKVDIMKDIRIGADNKKNQLMRLYLKNIRL
jgi:hypothetical protein